MCPLKRGRAHGTGGGVHFAKHWPHSCSSTGVSASERVLASARAVPWGPGGDPSGRLGQPCPGDSWNGEVGHCMHLTGWVGGLDKMTAYFLCLQLPLCWRTAGGFPDRPCGPTTLFWGTTTLGSSYSDFGLCSNTWSDYRESNIWPSVSPTDEMGHNKCHSRWHACGECWLSCCGGTGPCVAGWTLELVHL